MVRQKANNLGMGTYAVGFLRGLLEIWASRSTSESLRFRPGLLLFSRDITETVINRLLPPNC